MRLDRVTIAGILGIARAEIQLKGVNVICAHNHAGKSSIADAIQMALIGTVSRVKIAKKDYAQLLHDGNPKGRVTVTYDGGEEEDGAQFRLPKGEHVVVQVENAQYLPHVIRPSLFAEISDDDRRTLLFNLTGCKASGKEVIAKLIARDMDEAFVRDFIPNLKNGFPAASEAAYKLATAAKGTWRGITKATWGSVIAEDWKALQPEGKKPTDKELETLLAQATKRQSDLEDGIAYVSQQEALAESSATYSQRLAQLEETAGLLKRRQAKLANTEKDLNEWEQKFPAMLEKLAELKAGSTPLICPCCDKELSMVDGKLEKFAGLKADTKKLSDAALAVTNARAAIDTLKKVHANDLRDIAESESAIKQVEQMKSEKIALPNLEKLERARESVAKLRTLASEERAAFNAMQQSKIDFEKVGQITQDAAAAHAEVKQWIAMGDALAPDGIPSDLLSDALAPFNQSLQVLSRLATCAVVSIGSDMQIRFGERLYGLCSVSEKWRCDALIAIAIAQMSTLKMVVLDGLDVLDTKSRIRMVQMAMQLEELTAMETIIMIATLKEKPKFPDSVGVVWVERCIAENEVS